MFNTADLSRALNRYTAAEITNGTSNEQIEKSVTAIRLFLAELEEPNSLTEHYANYGAVNSFPAW